MSTIFARLGAILVTWYPHFARNALQFPRACPCLPLMRRVGVAAAGVALSGTVAEAAGDVGGEGHVLLLSGHDAGRSVHSMSLMTVLIFAAYSASLAVSVIVAGILHHFPFHQRKWSGRRQRLAGHQPMLGGGPLCHVVIPPPSP